MADGKPTTIAAYIDAAPEAGRPMLLSLYALLRTVAPDAQEAIKWGTPFFIEPRFLFAFSAHKGHLNFTPPGAVFSDFAEELQGYRTTKGSVQVTYTEVLPTALIRRMAEHSCALVAARTDTGFW